MEVPAPNPRVRAGVGGRLELWGAWAVLGCEVSECVLASTACLTRSPW